MVVLSPRSGAWLAVLVDRIDDGTCSIAEICRRVGATADELRLARPSYEQVRTVVHDRRNGGGRNGTAGELELGVGIRLSARLGVRRRKR